MPFFTDDLWAGSEATFTKLLEVEAWALEHRTEFQAFSSAYQDKEEQKPYAVQDGVAVYRIAGPLTNMDPVEAAWWGVASYQGIQQDLLAAAVDPEVQHILLDIDSGGGSVAGLADTSEVIKNLGKPTTAYTSGSMYSAAYWLASSVSEGIHAAQMAGVGSIGVIATHVERSKMLEEMGIKATVLRAGEFKALASAVEPLTDKAREQLQNRLDTLYGFFVNQVAEARKVSYDVCDVTMAQGREFIGQQAKDAGLIDSITSLTDLLTNIAQSIDNDNQLPKNIATHPQGRYTMSKEQIEQAAASADEQAQVQESEQAAVEQPEASAPVVEEALSDSALLVALKAEMQKTLQLEASVASLTEKCDVLHASNNQMKDILLASVKQMSVALNQSADLAEVASVDQLLEMHGQLGSAFAKKFPAGGVASVSTEQAGEGATKAYVPQHRSRVAATQLRR